MSTTQTQMSGSSHRSGYNGYGKLPLHARNIRTSKVLANTPQSSPMHRCLCTTVLQYLPFPSSLILAIKRKTYSMAAASHDPNADNHYRKLGVRAIQESFVGFWSNLEQTNRDEGE